MLIYRKGKQKTFLVSFHSIFRNILFLETPVRMITMNIVLKEPLIWASHVYDKNRLNILLSFEPHLKLIMHNFFTLIIYRTYEIINLAWLLFMSFSHYINNQTNTLHANVH